MKKCVSIITNGRIEYYKKCVDSILRNKNLQEWDFFVFNEPHENIHLMNEQSLKLPNIHIYNNQYKFGCPMNTFQSIHHPIDNLNYDFVVKLEEDVIVSRDVLSVSQYYVNNYSEDKSIACLSLANTNSDPKDPSVFRKMYTLSPYAFVITKFHWNRILRDFNFFNDERGWDFSVNRYIQGSVQKRCSIYPEYSRIKHIGEHGMHMMPEYEVNRELLNVSVYDGDAVESFTIL